MKKYLGMLMVPVFALCFSLFASGFSTCSEEPSQPKGDPTGTVMSACSACHSTQKVCDALGKKDKAAWTQTVDRMVGKGAAINKDSIPAVVELLAGLAPGTKPICR